MTGAGIDMALMAKLYLLMRRSMGYKLHQHGQLLLDFVRFLDATGAAHLTTAHALAWATLPADGAPEWWHGRLGVVRAFARYLLVFDPQTQVPETSLLPDGTHRATPYIFADHELDRLLIAAGQLTPSFRALTYRTYISLVAVTGMRRSEATAWISPRLPGTRASYQSGKQNSVSGASCRFTPARSSRYGRMSMNGIGIFHGQSSRRSSFPPGEPGSWQITPARSLPISSNRAEYPSLTAITSHTCTTCGTHSR